MKRRVVGKRRRREEVSLLPTIQASRKLFSFIVGFYLTLLAK
jgi:hypothetical protein